MRHDTHLNNILPSVLVKLVSIFIAIPFIFSSDAMFFLDNMYSSNKLVAETYTGFWGKKS